MRSGGEEGRRQKEEEFELPVWSQEGEEEGWEPGRPELKMKLFKSKEAIVFRSEMRPLLGQKRRLCSGQR